MSAPTKSQSCRLETLPPELHRQLLATLPLARLKNLVRASPIIHQQYLMDRRYILNKSLQLTIGDAVRDAHDVYLFQAALLEAPATFDKHKQSWLSLLPQRSFVEVEFTRSLNETEAVAMAGLYLGVVSPIASHFAADLLARLAEQEDNHGRRVLSKLASVNRLEHLESSRILRAIYQFQLLCYAAVGNPTQFDTDEEAAVTIFNTLPPWEVESLYTLYSWVVEQFEFTIEEVKHRLAPTRHPGQLPGFDSRARPPATTIALEWDTTCMNPANARSSLFREP